MIQRARVDRGPGPLSTKWRGTGRGVCSFILVAALGCAHTPPRAEDWVTLESPHFALYTDTSPGTYQPIFEEIEGVYTALHAAFFPHTDLLVEVLLFSSPESQQDTAKRALRVHHEGPRPLVLTARTVSRYRGNNPYTTLPEEQAASELCKRFLRANMRYAPLWFRNGLADYAQTVEVKGGIARFGHRQAQLSSELAAGRVIPLGQLIAARAEEFSSGDWRRSHQASAWAFIHYLLGGEDGALRPRFDALARALMDADSDSPAASRAALAKAFPDEDFATLEAKARDYAADLGRRPGFHPMVLEIAAPAPPPPPRPAEPEHLKNVLAGLH
jgi:hypothetical protein